MNSHQLLDMNRSFSETPVAERMGASLLAFGCQKEISSSSGFSGQKLDNGYTSGTLGVQSGKTAISYFSVACSTLGTEESGSRGD